MGILGERVAAVLSTTPERWQRLVRVLPMDMLTRVPKEGEWSALECLRHLVDAEQTLFPVRVRMMLAREDFVDFDPKREREGVDELTPEELVVMFAQLRRESLELIKGVRDEDLERTVQHPKLGVVTLGQLLNTWAGHDLMHTVQAERALMQPFMLECGPWRVFFRDHEVGIGE